MHHARELRKQMAGGGESKPQAKRKIIITKRSASYEEMKNVLTETARQLSVAPLAVPQRVSALRSEVEGLEKQLAERASAGPLTGERLLESAEQIDGVTIVVTELPGVEGNLMRQLIDQIRGKTKSSAVLLATEQSS